jgi:hypothetical protein
MSDSFVGVRLPKEVKQQLQQAAQERGTSLSEYIRHIFGGHDYIQDALNERTTSSNESNWWLWAKRLFWGTIITGIVGGIAHQFGKVILDWLLSF